MKSKESKQNNIMVNKEQAQRNETDILKENKTNSEQKDGFRYDYDDSSDLK